MALDDLSGSVANGSSLHEAGLCLLFLPSSKINGSSQFPLGDAPFSSTRIGVVKKEIPQQSVRCEEDCLRHRQAVKNREESGIGRNVCSIVLCPAEGKYLLAFQLWIATPFPEHTFTPLQIQNKPGYHILQLLRALPNLKLSLCISLNEFRTSLATAAGSECIQRTLSILKTRAECQVSEKQHTSMKRM